MLPKIYYQCVDLPNFYGLNKHRHLSKEGVEEGNIFAIDGLLLNEDNEGAYLIGFERDDIKEARKQGIIKGEAPSIFIIKDGTMLPTTELERMKALAALTLINYEK